MSRAENAAKKCDELREQIKSGGDFEKRKKFNFVQLKDDKDKRILRVIPIPEALRWYLDNDEGEYTEDAFPYGEFYKHWKVGPNKVKLPCLSKHNNEDCPVCELIAELKATGEPDDKTYADDMWASARFVWFVIDREDEEPDEDGDEKWFVWEVSNTVNEQLMSLIANPKIPDLDHVFEGTDIEVTRKGKKGDPKTKYDIFDTREVSYLFTDEDGEFDYERAERLLSVLPDVTQYGAPFLSYDETKAVMEGESFADVFSARNEDAEESEEAEEKEEEKPVKRGRGRGKR